MHANNAPRYLPRCSTATHAGLILLRAAAPSNRKSRPTPPWHQAKTVSSQPPLVALPPEVGPPSRPPRRSVLERSRPPPLLADSSLIWVSLHPQTPSLVQNGRPARVSIPT
ncbi:hypothetical protein XA68_15192 [Ophiocordyceps unilateralis]|uniref:Uncharacterized protein n=1 Tax=Ophiocordyceps unilateralis TaxID=268505 RepID=A0A2A9P8M3_OPHUN|nr:hypothetical protein XA68_15192 [Ophiocordyceps unilateralis]